VLPQANAGKPAAVHALNFSTWKRAAVRRCFPGTRTVFVDKVGQVPPGGVLVVWGMAPLPDDPPARLSVLRIEDGFLRSVGLGADLIRPMSWVVDSRGIYYDATQASDLEHLLAHASFDAALLERAAFLRKRIVNARLTKYNVGATAWQRPATAKHVILVPGQVESDASLAYGAPGIRTNIGATAWQRPATAKHVILVPGQVESDASLAYGAPGIRTNIGLLRAVRAANPQAHVLYKPHPDVLARLRAKGAGEDQAQSICDEVVTDAAMGDLLLLVDEVHVLTSLAGFEALLRDKPVTCHGQPFYAGWGLTRDLVPVARRQRRLSLDELIAGALITYPLYFSRRGDGLITPEQALDELVGWRASAGLAVPWWRKCCRVILRRVVGVR